MAKKESSEIKRLKRDIETTQRLISKYPEVSTKEIEMNLLNKIKRLEELNDKID